MCQHVSELAVSPLCVCRMIHLFHLPSQCYFLKIYIYIYISAGIMTIHYSIVYISSAIYTLSVRAYTLYLSICVATRREIDLSHTYIYIYLLDPRNGTSVIHLLCFFCYLQECVMSSLCAALWWSGWWTSNVFQISCAYEPYVCWSRADNM